MKAREIRTLATVTVNGHAYVYMDAGGTLAEWQKGSHGVNFKARANIFHPYQNQDVDYCNTSSSSQFSKPLKGAPCDH